jgi:hypothetical protein
MVREHQGMGLKEAKELVDGYVAMHPEIEVQLEQRRALGKRNWLAWIVFLGLLALFAVQCRSLRAGERPFRSPDLPVGAATCL